MHFVANFKVGPSDASWDARPTERIGVLVIVSLTLDLDNYLERSISHIHKHDIVPKLLPAINTNDMCHNATKFSLANATVAASLFPSSPSRAEKRQSAAATVTRYIIDS